MPKKIWIVGSSIIKRGFVHARSRPGGSQLGLGRIGASLWWQGKGGMRNIHLQPTIRTLLKVEDPPQMLILHCGGNDLVLKGLGHLRVALKESVLWLQETFPGVLIVWSHVLPRLHWRGSNKPEATEKARRRLNAALSGFILKRGGAFIQYPDITLDEKFFDSDQVHLSSLGNDIFVNVLQGAIEAFLTSNARVFPELR